MPPHGQPPAAAIPDDGAGARAGSYRWPHLVLCVALLALPLFFLHLPLLGLPYFWDELGQFVPTALDLLRSGAWVAHSTLPNVHPPGVEAYLVLWYKLFGYSIPVTRVAMLALSSVGLLAVFLLAIELSRQAERMPAFLPPLLLLVSPIFYTQSMMAQLDMPAMVFTMLALLLFLREHYGAAALASVALVLCKETGVVTPAVFFCVLAWRRKFREAALFVAAPVALGAWLIVLRGATGFWLGNPGFAHYNVAYSLQPVRLAMTLVRRIFYLCFAEFRWVGTLAIAFSARKLWALRSPAWMVTALVAGANLLVVTLFGGAALERYLLPVLPLFYILASMALMMLARWPAVIAAAALFAGLGLSVFWNPPYPFPFENNFAMVDFVRLQQLAANYTEEHFPNSIVATAWPYTAALAHPEYGFVTRPLATVETNDFHEASVRAIPPRSYDELIVYTRTWAPSDGVLRFAWVREFLERYYHYAPPISPEQCADLGLAPVASWERRGQAIAIYRRSGPPRSQDEARAGLAGQGL